MAALGTHKKFLRDISLILVIVAFLSCSDDGGFMNLPGDDPPQITTVDDGALLGDSLQLRLLQQRGASASTYENLRLEITLRDSEGNPVGEPQNLDAGRFLSADPEPIPLPEDLEPGLYQVKIELLSASGVERQADRVVFLGFDPESYGIDRVEFHPDFVFPGSDVIVAARVRVPVESDPFLRWTLGDSRQEGKLSEGLHELRLQAPDKEGFYPVTLELFPFEPPQGWGPYSFASTLRSSGHRMIVRRGAESSKSTEFFSLLQLQGNLREEGVRLSGREQFAEPVGAPQFTRSGDRLGYRFGNEDALVLSDAVLPFRAGVLTAFQLELHFTPRSLDNDGAGSEDSPTVILTVETRSEGPRLTLLHDSEGRLILKLGVRDAEYRADTPEPVLAVDEPMKLGIVLLPEREQVQVLFAVDEEYSVPVLLRGLRRDDLRVADAFLRTISGTSLQRAAGTTVLGGGFQGMISHFGLRTTEHEEFSFSTFSGTVDDEESEEHEQPATSNPAPID